MFALVWLGYETDGLTVRLPYGKMVRTEKSPVYDENCTWLPQPRYRELRAAEVVSTASWREDRYSMEARGFEGACGPAGCSKQGHAWGKRNMLAMKDADKPYRVKVRDRTFGKKKGRLIEVPIERAELYH